MIVWQSNGYGEIRITKGLDEGVIRIDSGYNVPGDKFHSRYALEVSEEDRLRLLQVFGEGIPDCHTKSCRLHSDLSLTLEIYGTDCGNVGDWTIRRGQERLISGSCNFKGLVEALTYPGEFVC